MKKKLLSCLLGCSMILSLCSCGTNPNVTGGSPWINSNIEENVRNNPDVALKDDFALAIDKDWVLANPLESGVVRNDNLLQFENELNSRLKDIITDDSYKGNHDAELVSTYYNAYLDWESRDADGVEPLLPYLEDINNIQSLDDFYDYSTKPNISLADTYSWGFGICPDDATCQNIEFFAPLYFLSGPEDYKNMKKLDSYVKYIRDSQKELIADVLTKCDYSEDEINAIFDGALEFEAIFMQYCYSPDDLYLSETMDTINTQIYTVEELSQFEGMDTYLQLLENLGITDIPQIHLYEKLDYFEHLNDIYTEENVEIIKDYLIAHTAAAAVSMLDKELYYNSLDVTNTLTGATGYREESDYAIESTSSVLGWPLSKLYCEKYVTEEDKQNVYEVICDVIEEYKLMISEEEFLSEETKANAINKLDNMAIHCMYPDTWKDYSELELSGSFLDMSLAIVDFEMQCQIEAFHEPINRENWDQTPITANASYSPYNNSINIFPGLVGDVLYRSDMEKEELYSTLGVVIGHEISHGFDPNGAKYDEVGNITDWWTAEDYEAFEQLTSKLVNYYDNITIWKGLNCNGELVKSEACADMAGVACMLRLAAKEPDFDYDSFFRNYAILWAGNHSANFDRSRALFNEHPLNYLRINVVVSQFDEFYETYDIKEGDGMYIAPEDRVKIW